MTKRRIGEIDERPGQFVCSVILKVGLRLLLILGLGELIWNGEFSIDFVIGRRQRTGLPEKAEIALQTEAKKTCGRRTKSIFAEKSY